MDKALRRTAIKTRRASDIDESHVAARTVEGVQHLEGFFSRSTNSDER